MVTSQRKTGAILSYLSLVINAIGTFLYVPILLGSLTTSEYGVYQLVGSIIAYLSVMDMGLSTTLNRYYVQAKVKDGPSQVENLLSHAAVIYGILTVLAVAVGCAFYAALGTIFGGSFTEAEVVLAKKMMLLVIANCIIVLPGNWFLAVINANERFVFARSLSIVKYVMQIFVVIAVLQAWPSALAVLIVQVALNALTIVAYIFYVKGRLKVRAKFHHWDGGLVRGLFSFSFFILLSMVFDQVFWKTGQVVLGAVVGATAVGVYGIVCQLITAGYMQVSTGVTGVFLPKLTAISARTDDMSEINELFNRIGHIQAILVWGVMVAFAILGQEFVYLWAGPEFSEVYPAVLVLMAGLCISLIQNLGISLLQAKNKMGFRSVVYIILAILDVLISIPISTQFGVMGCAVVAALLLFVGTGPVMNVYYHRVIGIDIPSFYRAILPLMGPIVVTGLIVWGFASFAMPVYSWMNFIIEVIVFCGVYFLMLWVFGFNGYERALFKNAVHKFSRRES